jgi:hypothetical protein
LSTAYPNLDSPEALECGLAGKWQHPARYNAPQGAQITLIYDSILPLQRLHRHARLPQPPLKIAAISVTFHKKQDHFMDKSDAWHRHGLLRRTLDEVRVATRKSYPAPSRNAAFACAHQRLPNT